MPEPIQHNDEFYVGYLKPVPRGYARRLRGAVLILALLVAGVAAAAVAFQADPGDAVWSSEPIELTGLFSAEPYPVLRIPGRNGAAAETIILVGAGKCGAFEPSGFCGLWGPTTPGTADNEAARRAAMTLFNLRLVTVRGTALRRGGAMMVELAEGERAVVAAGEDQDLKFALTAPAEDLGEVTLRGEVIDPKCYLGAMKPGQGKTHRACAVRCISGGIPPMLVAPSAAGLTGYLLTDPQGHPLNNAILPFVGDTVEATGRAERWGDLLVLKVDPATLRRI